MHPSPAAIRSLPALREAEQACRRCPLYKDATQVVPGEGLEAAPMLIVGEQPGDQEDIAGKPFVGPAGRLLDEALEAAGIARAQTFVTNAVKHFKHEMRGKRRLHKKPSVGEIECCRQWLDLERALLQPSVVVALGATAARSLLARAVTVGALRGEAMPLPDGSCLVLTIHPSYLLRIRDRHAKRAEFARFVADLRLARAVHAKRAASRRRQRADGPRRGRGNQRGDHPVDRPAGVCRHNLP